MCSGADCAARTRQGLVLQRPEHGQHPRCPSAHFCCASSCLRPFFSLLASLFLRAGSFVPGPVGLGLLLWPPGVGRHTAASDGSGGPVPLLGLATPPMKNKLRHHTRIISTRGTLLFCNSGKYGAYINPLAPELFFFYFSTPCI